MDERLPGSRHAVLVGPLPPPHGGRATYTRLLALNLLALRWEVLVLDTGGSGSPHHVPRSVAVPTRLGFVRAFMSSPTHPVLVTASDTRCAGYPLLAVLLGRVRGQRVVVNVLSGRFAADAAAWSPFRTLCERTTLRLSSQVVVCNAELANAVMGFRIPKAKVALAGCFLPHRDARGETPLPVAGFVREHSPVLVAVGSLRPLYRLPLAVEAVAHLRARHPTVGLVAVISGTEDDAERTRFLKAVASVGEEHVAVLREVAHVSLLELLRRCDVFLRLTTHDGDSVSLREALATGLPCVATRTGHRPRGVTIVSDATPEGVREAVIKALEEPRPVRGVTVDSGERNMRKLVESLTRVLPRKHTHPRLSCLPRPP